ncbi:unnamed protein product [Prorocentrum cordatum]|uniref:Uncharacterized protein n=1 Tax=Prorocentrum cordatum TaxID=2364126 RepID=A0ABN9WA41_9DINO|nr:unnamed protein product [Polarella glacialis]
MVLRRLGSGSADTFGSSGTSISHPACVRSECGAVGTRSVLGSFHQAGVLLKGVLPTPEFKLLEVLAASVVRATQRADGTVADLGRDGSTSSRAGAPSRPGTEDPRYTAAPMAPRSARARVARLGCGVGGGSDVAQD